MNRDKLIINMKPHIKKLVKKITTEENEDLESVGIIAVIKCVDKSLNVDFIENEEDINARCYVWARNAILNEVSKNRVKIDENFNTDFLLDSREIEDGLLLEEIKKQLNIVENKILEFLIYGKTSKEICKKLSISRRCYFYCTKKIKEIIALTCE